MIHAPRHALPRIAVQLSGPPRCRGAACCARGPRGRLFTRLQSALVAALLLLGFAVGACAPAQPQPTTTRPAGSGAAPPTAAPAAAQSAGGAPAPTAPAAPPAPSGVESFYRGKTVKIVVGFGAGGGFDVLARALSRHYGKYIPGNPTVIVENMPGAGSLVAANNVYNTAPKDGTTLVYFFGGHIVQQALGNTAVQFDAQRYNWLGAPYLDTPSCAVTRASGITRLEDAVGDQQLVLGGTAPGSNDTDIPVLLRNLLGLNVKMVTGYDGLARIWLATKQGEVMGACQAYEGMRVSIAEDFASGEMRVIAQGGRTPHPDLPNVPLMRDLARTDEQRQLIDVSITLSSVYNRPIALPPGVPAERVRAMREALAAAWKDPALVADARQSMLELDPVSAEEIEGAVKAIFDLSPELREKLKAALTP
jgi:tripartite-type tricarboxylate transporter receptor subunit TctC